MGRLHPALRRQASLAAKGILWDLGIDAPEHIRLQDIIEHLRIQLRFGSLPGAAARLLRSDAGAVIRVSADDLQTPKQHFSLAHEVGHFLLHKDSLSQVCSAADIDCWSRSKRLEAQANVFAAELLLPQDFVRPIVAARHLERTLVEEVASIFRCSFTAAAIRVVELGSHPCAVVAVNRTGVQWSAVSDELPEFFIQADHVPRSTPTGRFIWSGRRPLRPTQVDPSHWLGPKHAREYEVCEECIPMPSYSGALALLHFDPV